MTRPRRYLNNMIFFVAVVAVVAIVLSGPLASAFMANWILNGVILAVLLAGIVYVFRQVLLLGPAVDWLSAYRRAEKEEPEGPAPELLTPMAAMLAERRGRVSLSTLSMRSLLDSIGSRLDESR